MRAQSPKLSRKQTRAVAALIEEPTIKGAAKTSGVGEATIFRWLQDPEFLHVYRGAKRRVVDQAVARLQKASGDAVTALKKIVNDEDCPPSPRVTAAKAILELSVKAIEMEDLVSRIETIERFIANREGR